MTTLKLPLSKIDHKPCGLDECTHVIVKVSNSGEVLAQCTCCPLQWRGNWRIHCMPEDVARALMSAHPEIKLKPSRYVDGWVAA